MWFRRRGLLPTDIAYQGFGAGLEEDCYALRLALESDLDFMRRQLFFENIACTASGSGINRALRQRADRRRQRPGALKTLIRRSYSRPPTRQRIVDMVLADAQLLASCGGKSWRPCVRVIQQMRLRLSAGLEQGGSQLDYRRIPRSAAGCSAIPV